MRYDGHGASYEEMKRERLERLAEDRKTAVNEREKAEDAKNVAKMQDREEKKPVEYKEGGLLQSDYEIKAEDVMKLANTQERIVKKEKEQEMTEQIVTVNEDEIRAEVYADIRAALKVLEEFPELVRLVVSKDENL